MGGEGLALVGISVYVLLVAWVSRHIALDMDNHGKAGWAYGMLTLVLPPLGVAFWLLDRNRPATHGELRPKLGSPADALLFLVLIVTFPLGLLVLLFANRRASA